MSTGIQWTDETWNCVVGCTQVSPGCAHCYAKALHDMRRKAYWAGKEVAPQYAQPFETVQLMPSRLMEPLHWRKPRKVFVNSVADLFHDEVPDEFIDQVFAVMALAEWHTFQVLTKRPARMLAYMTERWQPVADGPEPGRDRHARVRRAIEAVVYGPAGGEERIRMFGGDRYWSETGGLLAMSREWPLPNVWLGVSVENQRFADERIPLLMETPAAKRFLSCEPLLSPVDITPWLGGEPGYVVNPIDWVIVGGESGTGARPCDTEWIADVLAQCCFDSVPAFVKQLGAVPMVGCERLALRDSHGGDMAEWHPELRVREFPASEVRA